jgi:hypothetical protein
MQHIFQRLLGKGIPPSHFQATYQKLYVSEKIQKCCFYGLHRLSLAVVSFADPYFVGLTSMSGEKIKAKGAVVVNAPDQTGSQICMRRPKFKRAGPGFPSPNV